MTGIADIMKSIGHLAGRLLPAALSLLLAGCFEEDARVDPHIPGDEISFRFESSIYEQQSFFDLGSNRVISRHENEAWLIRFAARETDHCISVNSAALWAVYNTATDDPAGIPENPDPAGWIFDASSGNPDSTAFHDWVRISDSDTVYTRNLYLIGRYDGLSYQPAYVAQFLHVDAQAYQFRIRTFPEGAWTAYTIPKDPARNFSYFDPAGEPAIVELEPAAGAWDLLFSQYGTILYTDEGVPTPYFVRGVLLNPSGVAAALDTLRSFAEIRFEDIEGYTFSTREDFIGHDWKSVEVDAQSNTAVYNVRPGYTYIIRDTEGFYHKLRFISYYNNQGETGYPTIEHMRL